MISEAIRGQPWEPCKDRSADNGLTVREQIKAKRARDVNRVAKELATRPWDGKDLGQTKRAAVSL
jgi:hypothetical protein